MLLNYNIKTIGRNLLGSIEYTSKIIYHERTQKYKSRKKEENEYVKKDRMTHREGNM